MLPASDQRCTVFCHTLEVRYLRTQRDTAERSAALSLIRRLTHFSRHLRGDAAASMPHRLSALMLQYILDAACATEVYCTVCALYILYCILMNDALRRRRVASLRLSLSCLPASPSFLAICSYDIIDGDSSSLFLCLYLPDLLRYRLSTATWIYCIRVQYILIGSCPKFSLCVHFYSYCILLVYTPVYLLSQFNIFV